MTVRRLASATLSAAALVGCSPSPSFDDGASASTTTSTSTGRATPTVSAGAGGDGTGGTNTGGNGSGGADASSPSSSSTAADGGGTTAGATTTSGSTTSSVSTTVTVGSGSACRDAAECDDGNPCTFDACDSEGCHNTGVAPGSKGSSVTDTCAEGVCQLDATCGLQVYSHPYLANGAWETTTLSEFWGGSDDNAPPFTGIREVLPVPALGYFAVLTDEGGATIIRVRGPAGWLAPQPAATYLPGLPTDIRCAYSYQPDAANPTSVLLLAGPGPTADLQQAFLYTVDGAGVVTADGANPYAVDRSDEMGSPPPNADLCRWSFSVQTGFLGDPSWVVAWDGTGENVYHFDGGSSVWTDYGPDVGSPIWEAEGTGPAAQSVVAAWYEHETVYLIAP